MKPPRARSYNGTVETLRRTIEDKFYRIESFSNQRGFHRRAMTWWIWYNLQRTNMDKENQSRGRIIETLRPDIKPSLFVLPPCYARRARTRRRFRRSPCLHRVPRPPMGTRRPAGNPLYLWQIEACAAGGGTGEGKS